MADETKRLKFNVDLHYGGRAVGPNSPEQEADVDSFWAEFFLSNECATEVKAAPVAQATTASPKPALQIVQNADAN